MTGHVFLIRGDITRLRCDAIGYSGDAQSLPSSTWRAHVQGEPLPGSSQVDARRVVRRWKSAEGEPIPYVVPIAGTAQTPVDWYLAALRVFLQRATADLRASGKGIPKLAIPLLGASKGGQERAQGELLEKTLDELWSFTRDNNADVALVFNNDQGFDAAQAYRRRQGSLAWENLPAGAQAQADHLASLAVGGDMALFLGAGVSMSAGIPSWQGLLSHLSAGALSDDEVKETEKLSALDQAQLLAKILGEQELRNRVISRIKRHHRASFSHALLAALPVKEVATTNYDQLFEVAAEGAGRPVHVLPYKGSLSEAARWLLKLHGTVEKPEDIVLSRQTFLQYEASRAALAGLFAGVLLTRHVVFIGSSFSDDNILRIMEEVQRLGIQERSRSPRLGTCLAIGLHSVQKKLWEGDFEWIDFGPPSTGGRQLEIFLDRVLASTSTSMSYLFDRRFSGALSGEERQLRDSLEGLLARTQTIEHPVVGALLRNLAARLGWPGN